MNTPNYAETLMDGVTRWTRSFDITIKNPLGGTPFMILSEEKAYQFSDESFTRPSSSLQVSFDLNNPKHLAVYLACNEVYIEEREKRDVPPVIPPV